MKYNRCGKSGLLLPEISLGLWHNFGSVDNFENAESIAIEAFDKGITHFDLANNYGPVPGSAEENFGKILWHNFQGNLRDEIVISTKAGYTMWDGPYGDWGSRKYLLSSLDQSLKRMSIDYVDIFYSHRPDPETPIEETMMALDHAVRSGKALYVGISNYSAEQTRAAVDVLKQLGTPCLIHQAKYSMLERWVENGLLDVLEEKGVGCIAFSPLAQGLLTDKYLNGIPENSRAHNPNGHLKEDEVTQERIQKLIQLNEIAQNRNQSLAQMALAWLQKDKRITSVLIGASSVKQLCNNIDCLQNTEFSHDELNAIEKILS
ncbi:L-glyceraldehyde 3-phosphate reductase [Flavobacterium sp. KACC 22758]|jgi:L-glyceraldehyde 3-phosphate reductase|uniref:L-glyceraldehyde 3-phosphate reductase n=1 Tax=Flavobacterium sp. KACC 22758 TaxID=3025667 RepID=UPI0023673903|nr:L-glyceraldehyde 3-phosphate reductase [Flavobacterium sp. KACC 22758]WDF58704.1 L-glyceraldehyde 3-phosphate reductase [Flavobacterium sp. KACC 22758]